MDPIDHEKVRVKQERPFSAHHLLLGIARRARWAAENENGGGFRQEMIAITFAAFALEALANTFGERLVTRWKDYENATPLAKLRVVAEVLRVGDLNFKEEPWSGAIWLTLFRNKVVHAKPQILKVEKVVRREESEKVRRDYPKSALELELTKANAGRAVKVVEGVMALFIKKIPIEEADGLEFDGFTSSESPE